MGRRTAAVAIATLAALLLVHAESAGARASGVAPPQVFATCGQPAFSPGIHTNSGTPPFDVLVADFDEDGLVDLAAVGTEPSLSVLIGLGTGGFAPPAERSIDIRPYAAVTGDFNGDGHADLAIGGVRLAGSGGELQVLLGNGSGVFNDGGAFPAGEAPGALATGDFNADGILDIAASDFLLQSALVLPGAGDGSFGPVVSIALSNPPSDVLVADFNNDGSPDLALTTQDPAEPHSAVELLLGAGDGTFAPPAIVSTPQVPVWSVSSGDFNEDGDLDLALMTVDVVYGALVLIGDGGGGFTEGETILLSGIPFHAAVADLNGDGHQDLAIAKSQAGAAGHFDVLVGDGTGGFGEPFAVPAGGAEMLSVGVADFDGDGRPDLVGADLLTEAVAVLLNLCGNIADLSVTISDSEDPILTTDTTTFTIQVVNGGPDAGSATVVAQLPDMTIPNIDGAVTTTHGACTIDADRHGIQCALGLLAGTAGGNVATITVQAGAQLPGSALTTATVSTNVADPDLSGNSAAETTQVTLLGGRQFTLGAAPGGAAEMTWSAGDAQAGYRIGRLAGGAVTVLPATGPLPPDATGFVDSAPLAGQTNCYSVAAVDEGGEAMGVSPLLCLRQGSATGAAPPATFTIELPSVSTARLRWSGTGGETGYVLGIYQGGQPPRYRTFAASTTGTSFNTGLQPICFVLAAVSGSTVTGSSDLLCAAP